MTTGQQIGVRTMDPQVRERYRQERLRRLARMREAAGQLVTAELLERRAERAESPALASLLRQRAGERRSLGERLLAGPPGGPPGGPPRIAAGPRAGGEAVRARRL